MKKLNTKGLKVGDKIKVITGNKKGLLGNIFSICTKKKTLIVDSMTSREKNIKSLKKDDPKKIYIPRSLNISNVMLWDASSNACSKVGYKMINGEKKRYFKKSGNIL